MNSFIRLLSLAVFVGTSLTAGTRASATQATPNVLFITVDDLRPELGCYEKPYVVSPNIDRLAARGVVFQRAYCQQAVCNPSRASFLTGLRPDTTGVYDLVTHFRKKVPDVVTLPQLFKEHGYHTQAIGKIYHPAFPGYGIGSDLGDPVSWSEPHWLGGPRYYYSPLGEKLAREAFDAAMNSTKVGGPNWVAEVKARKTVRQNPDSPSTGEDEWKTVNVRVLATEAPEVPDETLYDGQVAERAIAALRRQKERQDATPAGSAPPIFLAVGFLKPHLPFIAPRKYWDLYDPDKLETAVNPGPPHDAPAAALAIEMDELRDTYPRDVRVPAPGSEATGREEPYYLPKAGPLTREQAIQLRRGYYACVSYVDAQVGRILAELERLDLARNTIIVLVGDHGFSLGEHGLWGKLTNFEDATRAPLIIASPGRFAGGARTSALVELVDIYPTLCDLAGLPKPDRLEGTSLVPLLEDPGTEWKTAAFSQYPRKGLMGYTMRTDRYRYTVWQSTDDARVNAGTELYDHTIDPAETMNLARLPQNATLVAALDAQLKRGWRGAVPAAINNRMPAPRSTP
jgi:iduronate 2-sulfatase